MDSNQEPNSPKETVLQTAETTQPVTSDKSEAKPVTAEPYDPGESVGSNVTQEVVTSSQSADSKKSQQYITSKPNSQNHNVRTDSKSKRLDKSRRKNEKNYELYIKSLSGLSLQDQNEVLMKRVNEMMEEISTLTNANKIYKTQTTMLLKEKEQLQAEQNRNLVTRTKLESICRELQKQNKQIKDETSAKIREEEEKRKEVTTKFQATLNDVSKMMEQNSTENIKLRDDNIEISDRFKKLCEEFKAREGDIQQIKKQMEYENQYHMATLERCRLELESERCEKESWLKEKEELLKKLHDTTKDNLLLEMSIKNMEEQLGKYSDKYQKFESTITKSNEVFESYKSELSSMASQINKLEKDCFVWRDRSVQTSQALTRLISINSDLERDLGISEKKLDQLAGLCRFLQNERTRYLKQLEENNIKPDTTSTADASQEKDSGDSSAKDEQNKIFTSVISNRSKIESVPPSMKTQSLTAKEKELQTLRVSMAKLQAEINKALENDHEQKIKSRKETETRKLLKSEPESATKTKCRSKSKKNKKNSKTDESSNNISTHKIDTVKYDRSAEKTCDTTYNIDNKPVEVSNNGNVAENKTPLEKIKNVKTKEQNKQISGKKPEFVVVKAENSVNKSHLPQEGTQVQPTNEKPFKGDELIGSDMVNNALQLVETIKEDNHPSSEKKQISVVENGNSQSLVALNKEVQECENSQLPNIDTTVIAGNVENDSSQTAKQNEVNTSEN